APGALAIAMPSQTSEWRAPRAESSHADEGHGPLTWDLLARAAQVDKARSEVESITIYVAPLRRERLGERSRDLRHNQPHLVLEEPRGLRPAKGRLAPCNENGQIRK